MNERRREVEDCPEVLFVALADGLGGSMRSLATLLKHTGGCYRTVAAPAPSKFVELIEDLQCFERRLVISGPRKGRARARVGAALNLARYAWRRRHALVAIHANGLSDRNVVALAALLARVPVVVWAHEGVSPWSRRLSAFLNWINPATTVVAVSEYGREQLVTAGLISPNLVEVIPNPIDPDDVRAPQPPGAPSLTTAPVVGYLGSSSRIKGFDLLPEVIKRLQGDNLRWVIFSGPRQSMPETWSELECLESDRVALEAKVVEVQSAYARCDIVYCPSRQETFGRVVAEAMVNGIPVVASNLPTLAELLGGGSAGLLVPAGDAGAAAEAIRDLARDPLQRAALGRAGRQLASKYRPELIARRMAALYGLSPEAERS